MEEHPIVSTAVLSLTLGVAAPAYAQQEQHDQQEEQKAQPAQEEKKTQPEKPAKPDEKTAQQQDTNSKQGEKNAPQQGKDAKPEEKNAPQQQHSQQAKPVQQEQHASGNGSGHIPDDRYRANFGQKHRFRVSQGDYSNRRFQYGGYSFGFVDAWPSNWLYTQDVYVIEINGMYFLCHAVEHHGYL